MYGWMSSCYLVKSIQPQRIKKSVQIVFNPTDQYHKYTLIVSHHVDSLFCLFNINK